MELHVAARQQAISTEMNNRMRINITKLIHNCVDEGDIQTAAVVALLMRQRLDLDALFFARLISNYVRECRQQYLPYMRRPDGGRTQVCFVCSTVIQMQRA